MLLASRLTQESNWSGSISRYLYDHETLKEIENVEQITHVIYISPLSVNWSSADNVGERGQYSAFDRDFDIGDARTIGFKGSADHVEGYHIASDRMRDANIIPEVLEPLAE